MKFIHGKRRATRTFKIDVYMECVLVAVVQVDHVGQNVARYRVMSEVLLANDASKQHHGVYYIVRQ